jgi:hypothetical protein
MPVVYLLTNEVSKKKYVGVSKINNEQTIIDKACVYNKQIKNDIDAVGIDNFSTKILFESNDRNKLNSVRLKEVNSLDNSYHNNKRSQRSISINDDTINMINYYMENKGCSFSKAVDDLVGIGGLFFLSNQYNA